jgi:hypothetical protein
MTITEDDLWNAVYADFPETLHPGEKTVAMMARDRHSDIRLMKRFVEAELAAGKLKLAGMRRMSNGKISPADVPVKQSDTP